MMFPRKYGIKSRDTGTVGTEGYRFRTSIVPALYCVWFEWIEDMAGVDSKGWVVEEYVPKGSHKWNSIMNQER